MLWVKNSSWLLVAGAMVLLSSIPAEAIEIYPEIYLDTTGSSSPPDLHNASIGRGVSSYFYDDHGNLVELYTWTLDDPTYVENARIESWEMKYKVDPYVISNLNVTNTSSTDQTFNVSTLLGIPDFTYDRVINSSVGVTATDSNGDGHLYFDAATGSTVYDGLVNGSSILTMDPNNPDSLPLSTASSTCGGAGCSVISNNYVSSLVVTSDVANSIGLGLGFILSPGDSAAITSRFEIIPEPSTGLLLALGLMALGLRRHG
ncbi:MAG: PEP-CTERM sorting domain-containing protein [Pirellulales bacterium]|nr:PEP-CTERM sorting domain-containing protein [Pirellulales bacterium]